MNFQEIASPDARSALANGQVAESIRILETQIAAEQNDLLKAYLRMQRARLLGDSQSADEEWKELTAINAELAHSDEWTTLGQRGYGQLYAAMNRWNLQRDEEALRHIEEAKYLAGRAADPKLALRVLSLEFHIRDSLGQAQASIVTMAMSGPRQTLGIAMISLVT